MPVFSRHGKFSNALQGTADLPRYSVEGDQVPARYFSDNVFQTGFKTGHSVLYYSKNLSKCAFTMNFIMNFRIEVIKLSKLHYLYIEA